MKETRKHTDEEVARVMDTLAIAIRNNPANLASSAHQSLDAKKEEGDQSSKSVSTEG